MRTHELKTDPVVFDLVADGHKTFEIRKNDRGFEVGDKLRLRKTRFSGESMKEGAPLQYIGDELLVTVGYIMRGPAYGLMDGWVIMSLED